MIRRILVMRRVESQQVACSLSTQSKLVDEMHLALLRGVEMAGHWCHQCMLGQCQEALLASKASHVREKKEASGAPTLCSMSQMAALG